MIRLMGAAQPVTAEEAINVLEKALEMARHGELVQVAVAYVTDDGCTGHTYGATKNTHFAMLLGAIDVMHAAVLWELNNCGGK